MTFSGESYNDRFVADLVTFVAGDTFQSMFENFFITYATEFSNEEEHKLRYYELYQKFHDMFERQLEGFCSDTGCTQAEFMKRCRDASTSDPKAKHYIDILLSSVEYDTFVKLMRLMRPVALQRAAGDSDSKTTSGMSGDSDSKRERSSPAKASAKEEITAADSKTTASSSSANLDDADEKFEKASAK